MCSLAVVVKPARYMVEVRRPQLRHHDRRNFGDGQVRPLLRSRLAAAKIPPAMMSYLRLAHPNMYCSGLTMTTKKGGKL